VSISAVDGSAVSASRSCRITPGDMFPGTHLIRIWMGPGGGLEAIASAGNLTLAVQASARRYTD
jgi:hypothetical protein